MPPRRSDSLGGNLVNPFMTTLRLKANRQQDGIILTLQKKTMDALLELDSDVNGITSGTALEEMKALAQKHIQGLSEKAIACLKEFFEELHRQIDDTEMQLDQEVTRALGKCQAEVEAATKEAAAMLTRGGRPYSNTSPSSPSDAQLDYLVSFKRAGDAGKSAGHNNQPTGARREDKDKKDQHKDEDDGFTIWGRDTGSDAGIESKAGRSAVSQEPNTGGDYEHLDPVAKGLLKAGDQLKEEFIADTRRHGTEGWQDGDEEYAGLQARLDDANLKIEEQQVTIVEQDEIIMRLKENNHQLNQANKEIRENNNELTTLNEELKETVQGMPLFPNSSTRTSETGTPVPGRLGSVGSFPYSNISGSPRGTNLSRVNSWLPKNIQQHIERLTSAIKRCNTDVITCQHKLGRLGTSKPTETGYLKARKSSAQKNRQDFEETVAFLKELSGQPDRNQNCLADEFSRLGSFSANSGMTSATNSMNSLRGKNTSLPYPSSSGGATPRGTSSRHPTPGSQRSGSEIMDSPQRRGASHASLPTPDATPSPLGSQDALTEEAVDTPKVASPADEAKGASTSPKQPESSPKATSSKGGSSPKVASPLAQSQTAPSDGDHPNDPVSEGTGKESDDPESATEDAVNAIDSAVLGVWSFFAHIGLTMAKHTGAWFRVMTFLYLVVCYVMSQIKRAAHVLSPFHDSGEVKEAPVFPPRPAAASLQNVTSHIMVLVTLQAYIACQRERSIWFAGNGLTRQYMLERLGSGHSWWLSYGVDTSLIVGRRDVENVFKVAYVLTLASMKWLWSGMTFA